MDFLKQFTLFDVFLVAVGLVLASIIRIFYDSYKERLRLKKLGRMVKVYNDSMDIYEEGVLIISDKKEVIFANKEAARIFALGDNDVTMEYLKEQVSIRLSGASEEDEFMDIVHKRRNIPQAYIIVGNSSIPVSMNTNKFHMQFEHNDSWRIIILQDIASKLKLQERKDSMSSYKDLLTNLPTRYHLTSDLVTVILKAAQEEHESAIAMFGIRDFTILQTVNGIEKMDLVLRDIVRDVLSTLGTEVTLYRFDCDAFAMVFEDISDKNEIRRKMDSVALKAQNFFLSENIKAETMQSLYFVGQKEASVEKVLNDSCRVLRSKYNEKVSHGLASLVGNSADVNSAKYLASKLDKEDFLNGIKNKDFFFFYQPIYSLIDDTIMGVEVLTRLNHKKYGFLLADDFMPKAIEYGIMPEITSHLLENVLGQKKFWSKERGIDLDMTINLALSDLQSGIFTELLEKKLLEFKIDPKSIIIDIPEIVLAEDFDSVSEEFYMLSKMGVRLCIDHFGKESVSLKHLEILPLESVKIDSSIIQNIVGNEHKKRLISSIISIGNGLALKIGANHVDSEESRDLLRSLGCHFAQGHYFGKAVPAFEITDVIKRDIN